MTISLIPKTITDHPYRFEMYKDEAGDHRWRVTDLRNGQIIEASHQGYSRKEDCIASVKHTRDALLKLFPDMAD